MDADMWNYHQAHVQEPMRRAAGHQHYLPRLLPWLFWTQFPFVPQLPPVSTALQRTLG